MKDIKSGSLSILEVAILSFTFTSVYSSYTVDFMTTFHMCVHMCVQYTFTTSTLQPSYPPLTSIDLPPLNWSPFYSYIFFL